MLPIANNPTGPNTTLESQPPHHYNNPQLIVILLLLLFIGFFSLCCCKCFFHTLSQAWDRLHRNGSPPEDQIQSQQETLGQPPVNPGLDPEIIQTFPLFPFSSVKDLREDKHGLECAICLLEFEEEHILLRLLTTCYHVFHQECIDRWLECNKTCPVCRRNLDPTENIKELIIDVIHENSNGNQEDQTSTSNEVLLSRQSSCSSGNNERKMESLPDKFSRSKTTGHSIVRNKPEEEDRYTLRLPDHVKIKVMRRRNNNQTESCISFGELMRSREGRFGELSGQSLVPELEN